MKKFSVILFSLLSFNVFAESLTSNIYLNSNYVYRGISFSNHGGDYVSSGDPVLQVSVDYLLDSGFGASFFTGAVDSLNLDTFAFEKDQEYDLFLYYMKPLSNDLIVGVGYNRFNFVKNSRASMNELNFNVSYKFLKLDSSYSNNYSGAEVSLWYSKLAAKVPLTEKLFVTTHVGHVVFGDENKAMQSNYQDYKIGVLHSKDSVNIELSYTNTLNRKNLITDEVSNKDGAFTLSISKTLDLLN